MIIFSVLESEPSEMLLNKNLTYKIIKKIITLISYPYSFQQTSIHLLYFP